ncbi:VOC family protein [Roseicyclus mahoneyensis]|jgi:uncharacterized protein|uniref:VOC domain-containing protein n=1 Tax=Roseicyclus mahoneyensis TaxID=164332 RepID=A0A316GNR1_9RHOB|nr:glyoxalase family protein [Roseicyclus mahoneyensis]PWK61093.1 hypothetical protein C7455_103293 [Roseicyclus mahoneyensis]
MTTRLPIDYVEFTAPVLEETQAFFAAALGWDFVDYGPDYRDIQGAGTGGGLERGPARAPLIVLKADDLEGALAQVWAAGAEITKDIFAFPGGRRFEFLAPGGIAMAVWTT